MKFSDYTYVRPDFDSYKHNYLEALHNLEEAANLESAKTAIDELNYLRGTIDTAVNLASIRHSIDTTDPYYEAEDSFYLLKVA